MPKKILITEEDKRIRDLYIEILTQEGFDPVVVRIEWDAFSQLDLELADPNPSKAED